MHTLSTCSTAPRKLPRRLQPLAAAVLLATALASPSAHAGCGDNGWDFLAGVLTGGLSCAVQEAKREADRLLAEAQSARNRAQARYEEAVNGTNAKANEAKGAAEAKSQESMAVINSAKSRVQAIVDSPQRMAIAVSAAQTAAIQQASGGAAARAGLQSSVLVGAGGGGGSTPPAGDSAVVVQSNIAGRAQASAGGAGAAAAPGLAAPPTPEEVRQALIAAANELERLRARGANNDLPNVTRALAQMHDEVGRGIGNMHGLVRRMVFGPLEEVLRVLGMADPTGLTTLLAAAVNHLEAASAALDTEIFQAMRSLDDTVMGLIGTVEQEVDRLGLAAEMARRLDELVAQLSNNGATKAEVAAINNLIGASNGGSASVAQMRAVTGLVVFKLAATPLKTQAAAPSMKSDLSPLRNALRDPRVQAKFRAPAGGMASFSGGQQALNNEFANLSPAQREQKRQQMLADLRSRPGADPSKLAEAERVLAQAAGAGVATGVAAPAGLPPLPGAVGLPALPGAIAAPASPGSPAKPSLGAPPVVGAQPAVLGAPALGKPTLPAAPALGASPAPLNTGVAAPAALGAPPTQQILIGLQPVPPAGLAQPVMAAPAAAASAPKPVVAAPKLPTPILQQPVLAPPVKPMALPGIK